MISSTYVYCLKYSISRSVDCVGFQAAAAVVAAAVVDAAAAAAEQIAGVVCLPAPRTPYSAKSCLFDKDLLNIGGKRGQLATKASKKTEICFFYLFPPPPKVADVSLSRSCSVQLCEKWHLKLHLKAVVSTY